MPKALPPQHKNEIGLGVMAVKTEKSRRDCIWLNPKYNKMDNLAAKFRIGMSSEIIESIT